MKTIKLLLLMIYGALTIHAQESDAVDYNGKVTDQDGNAIAGANVCLYHTDMATFDRDIEYKGITDDNGNYSIRVDESDKFYSLSVESDKYPSYVMDLGFTVKEIVGSIYPAPKDIKLWNRLDFKKNQKATVILPEAPDPSWGRYYRIDHCEGRTVFFVREKSPQANVPYFIFPTADFSVDLSKYSLDNLPEPGYVSMSDEATDKRSGFCGTYTNMSVLGYVVDDTPDCSNGIIDDEKVDYPRVGAFRAYFTGWYSLSLEFVDEPASISHVTSTTTDSPLFNLQGHRLQGEPKHGVYIKNGKKVMR